MGIRTPGSILAARPSARPWRILIVDDVPDNREMYVEYLEFCGLVVDGASSAEEGLEKLEVDRIAADVVVMDLSLPDMDGIEATRRIKADPRLRETKVIMLSGYVGPAFERLAYQAGADTFLTKPCTPLDLLQTIVRLVPGMAKPGGTLERRSTRTRRKKRSE